MGVVSAYQGSEQLKTFGANIFIVDLVGISLLREIAPLVTAILVAGRSGSAYAAQIGTMDELSHAEDPWIHEYFYGPRGRAAREQAWSLK